MKACALPRNPFATRHTRPGVLPPLDAMGQPVDVPRILQAILDHRGVSIEGPHGTGKSTLLAAIVKEAREAGMPVQTVRLHSMGDAFATIQAIGRAPPGALVCLDGWEMLGPLTWVARGLAWCRCVIVVVTAHRAAGFRFAIRTSATLALLGALVDRLPDHGGLVDESDLKESLERHPDNLREALLDLYDRFEHRARECR